MQLITGRLVTVKHDSFLGSSTIRVQTTSVLLLTPTLYCEVDRSNESTLIICNSTSKFRLVCGHIANREQASLF
jgi:hypothetical protein